MSTFGSPSTGADNVKLDYDGSGNLIYVGITAPGLLTSDNQWQIRQFVYDGSGNLLSTLYVDGKKTYTNIWDNRVALTYA